MKVHTRRRHRTWVWVSIAIALTFLVAMLSLPGETPEPPTLDRLEAAGPMVDIPVDRVTEVDVRAGHRHWRFERAGRHWRVGEGAPPAGFAAHVDAGLRFLHGSAPERRVSAAGLEPSLAEAGLDPPRYIVSARTDDARMRTVAFGRANPRGLAQYARVDDEPEVLLLPRYVGEAWEAATGLR